MKFVSLHHHTTYSYMDGYGLPSAHAERAAELGMKALAVTDHGNVSAHVKHEIACRKVGIKPIFGLEAYTAMPTMREDGNTRKWHQTLLAMDQEGLHNLYTLVSISWEVGFYMWPTITIDMYEEFNHGLIATSGCLDGRIACYILGGKGIDPSDASVGRGGKALEEFVEIFGDRFYLECQRFPGIERCRALNPIYEKLSKKYKVPLVATADVHYPHPEDNEMQKILHAAGRNIGSVAAAEASWEYDIRLTHPISDKEVLRQLLETGLSKKAALQAIDNTAVIAERCNVTLPKMDRIRYPGTKEDLLPW